MNLIDETLSHFGGTANNNLNDALHLDILPDEDIETQSQFKLTAYHDLETIGTYKLHTKNSIYILSLNIESIFAKIDQLKLLIKTLHADNIQLHVITIQEAWLTEGRPLSLIEIENYKAYPQYNKIGGQKGGIVVYVHNSHTASEVQFFSDSPTKSWEGTTLDITGDLLNNPLRLHTIYRPPRDNKIDDFLTEFEPYLERLKSDRNDTIIAGDTNFNLLDVANNSKCQEYFDAMISYEFIPQITTPTKLNKGSCKLYDHIFSRIKSNASYDSCVYITDISDHLPVIFSIQSHKTNNNQPKFSYVRDTSEANYRRYLDRIAELTSNTHFDTSLNSNPNITQNKLHQILQTADTECFPIKKVRTNKYNTKQSPWITLGLLKSVKTKDTLYKQLKRTDPKSASYTKLEKKTQRVPVITK